MAFRTSLVDIDGEHYRLRELSGGALETMSGIDNQTTQGFALIALSLMNDDGRPRFDAEQIDAGLQYVRELPNRVIQRLSDAIEVLNDASMDGARKN